MIARRVGRGSRCAVGEVVVEHAVVMAGGDMCVRNPDPLVERVYPLALWIEGRQRETRVFRRRVVVVEDWVEVAR